MSNLKVNTIELTSHKKLRDIAYSHVDGGYYETAQVCINGHVITSGIESSKLDMQKFCQDCGKPTIIKCYDCKTRIRGSYRSPNVVLITEYIVPKFCYECGRPFPWTQAKLDSARELVEFEDKINTKEKEILRNSLDDIIAENPKTEMSAIKFKHIMAKVRQETAKALRDITVDIASETAKKILIGQNA
jgi:hypothetical protein